MSDMQVIDAFVSGTGIVIEDDGNGDIRVRVADSVMLEDDYDTDGDGKVNAADAADSVPWGGVTGKPSSFPAEAHDHDDRYFTEAEITAALAGKANTSHTHNASAIDAGTLAVARGGTGIASYTTNSYIRASGATTLQQRTPAQVLADIGAAAATHDHSAAQITSGTLAVARGGTGIGSYTAGNYMRASGAAALEQRTPAQVLADIGAVANAGGAPRLAVMTLAAYNALGTKDANTVYVLT